VLQGSQQVLQEELLQASLLDRLCPNLCRSSRCLCANLCRSSCLWPNLCRSSRLLPLSCHAPLNRCEDLNWFEVDDDD